MEDKKISIHHIGARSGSVVFPKNPKFDNDLVQVLYDADKDIVPQVEEIYKNQKPKTHILPYALWNKNENKEINMTIPVKFSGNAPGVRLEGGLLFKNKRSWPKQ